MILSDIQPHYFPRLHYFARMLQSRVFVFRDDVQFVRNHRFPDGRRGPSYQAHTPVRAQSGSMLLAVSIRKTELRSIDRTEISYEQPWARKHFNVLSNSYRKSLNGKRLLPELEAILGSRQLRLGRLNLMTIYWGLGHLLGMDRVDAEQMTATSLAGLLEEAREVPLRTLVSGSRLEWFAGFEGETATDRIVALCRHYGARQYVAGRTAVEAYLDCKAFAERDIELVIQDWSCPDYQQLPDTGSGFIPNLSIIDLLMNVPRKRALNYLLNGVRAC